jgi:hypothetical protein
VGDIPAWTKLLGQGAIYAINVTTEETAREAAKLIGQIPMERFDIRSMARALLNPAGVRPSTPCKTPKLVKW